MTNDERFKFRRKEGLTWEVQDTDSGFSIEFTEGLFNDEQKVNAPTDLSGMDTMDIARVMREIGDFVATSDLRFLAMCDIEERMDMLDFFPWCTDLLAEACKALAGKVTPDDCGEYSAEDIIDMMQPVSEDLKDILVQMTEEELYELVQIAFCYQIAPYGYEKWADDWVNFYHRKDVEY